MQKSTFNVQSKEQLRPFLWFIGLVGFIFLASMPAASEEYEPCGKTLHNRSDALEIANCISQVESYLIATAAAAKQTQRQERSLGIFGPIRLVACEKNALAVPLEGSNVGDYAIFTGELALAGDSLVGKAGNDAFHSFRVQNNSVAGSDTFQLRLLVTVNEGTHDTTDGIINCSLETDKLRAKENYVDIFLVHSNSLEPISRR